MRNRIQLLILQSASLLVPKNQRKEWLAEWSSELWYVRRNCATPFCFGAFQDAFWIRRHSFELRQITRMESPWKCLSLLFILAALTTFFTLSLPSVSFESVLVTGPAHHPLRNFSLIVLFSCLILQATGPLLIGEALRRGNISSAANLWRLLFLSAKIALIFMVVYFGSFYVVYDGTSAISGLRIHILLWGCAFALRWALNDQRNRCPVCLRLLSHPTRIGAPSNTFLEWYGTELLCSRGHGLMHVPEIRTSCYGSQQWLDLDASWRGLFSNHERRVS